MPFKPGQSGNPGGRPKKEGEIRKLAQQHCNAAIERLVELLASEDERVAKSAADSILDRGIGKPAQAIVGGEDGSEPIRHEIVWRGLNNS